MADPKEYDDRASWFQWFARFLYAQHLFVVKLPLPPSQAAPSAAPPPLTLQNSAGQQHRLGSLCVSTRCLREALTTTVSAAHSESMAVVTIAVVNSAFHVFFANWACAYRRIMPRAATRRVWLLTNEPRYATVLVRLGWNVMLLEQDQSGGSRTTSPLTYGTLAYQSLIYMRTALVDDLLQWGFPVLLTDVDMVWFQVGSRCTKAL